VQVAAYKTHDSASVLVKRLSARGYVAHIDGTTAPFRVRVGRFATEAQADSAARALKRKGIEGFVTPAGEPKL
jgi:cell division septation protein DedD